MDENKATAEHKLTKKQLRYLPMKRAIDFVLSTGAIIVLSPVLTGLAIAIKIDSPGPVLFKQKRVGKNKELFEIYKFRTMRTDTPSDKPTHMLTDPDQYITRVGRFLRRTSLDELAQLFNIWKGQMYIVSTRPALWNQYDLMEERDKYGVHDIAPGLTGWAQINGRDELEIPVKAKFDGEYIQKLSFWMDLKCFLGTIGSVLMHDGVVEGGTGKMYEKEQDTSPVVTPKKIRKEIAIGGAVTASGIVAGLVILKTIVKHLKNKKNVKGSNKTSIKSSRKSKLCWFVGGLVITSVGIYAFLKKRNKKSEQSILPSNTSSNEIKTLHEVDNVSVQKKVLITGANSYIGMSVESWLNHFPENYKVDTLELVGIDLDDTSFEGYDVIFHVAGIAHQKETVDNAHLYYEVNENLAAELAKKAKKEGVGQFVILSSMSVYGVETGVITKETLPKPKTHYGISKYNADLKIAKLADDKFKVATLRPPMVYGKGCKGNYQTLRKFALRVPFFPSIINQRSMVYIDNLAEFVKRVIDNNASGLFFPQDQEYVNTASMVELIAENNGKNIRLIGIFNPIIALGEKIGVDILKKVFGSLTYEKCDTIEKESFGEIMKKVEGIDKRDMNNDMDTLKDNSVLVSLITVTYNSEKTLKRTIESVLNQTYSNIEYTIVDGVSTDKTLEVAHRYEQDFAKKGITYRIISEPDNGMYDAINKGIDVSQGVIIGNVNSDDYYELDAVEIIVKEYQKSPYDMIYGDLRIIKESGNTIKKAQLKKFVSTRYWNHPTTFITKKTYDKEKYKCESMYDDCDLMLRLRHKKYNIRVVNKVLSNFVFGGMSTVKSWNKTKERIQIRCKIYGNNGYGVLYYLDSAIIEVAKYLLG